MQLDQNPEAGWVSLNTSDTNIIEVGLTVNLSGGGQDHSTMYTPAPSTEAQTLADASLLDTDDHG